MRLQILLFSYYVKFFKYVLFSWNIQWYITQCWGHYVVHVLVALKLKYICLVFPYEQNLYITILYTESSMRKVDLPVVIINKRVRENRTFSLSFSVFDISCRKINFSSFASYLGLNKNFVLDTLQGFTLRPQSHSFDQTADAFFDFRRYVILRHE